MEAALLRWWRRWWFRRFESAVARQIQKGRYSALNWTFETRSLIESVFDKLPPSNFHDMVVLRDGDRFRIQIDAHSGRMFKPLGGEGGLDREVQGSLVYSLHPNGSILVMASPHSSGHQTVPGSPFILEVLPNSWELAGNRGRRLIERHLDLFFRLCLLSRTEVLPTPKSGRFLEKLQRRSERFRSPFEDHKEARRYRISQEAGLAVGLIAGLLTSTILPFARDYGKECLERSQNALKACGASGGALERCLAASQRYYLDAFLGEWLTTPVLLIGALALATAVAFVGRGLIKQS